MGRTVRELLGSMSSRELTEWMAFDQVEPFGDKRGDLQAGVVAATVANVNRGKSTKPYQITDFVPQYGPQPESTGNSTAALMSHLLTTYGSSDESWETAEPSNNPDEDSDDERLRGAVRELAEHLNSLGGDSSLDGREP